MGRHKGRAAPPAAASAAVRAQIVSDARAAGMSAAAAAEYAEAIMMYLVLAASNSTNTSTVLATWNASNEDVRGAFRMHALPIAWDYAEANPFRAFGGAVERLARALERLPAGPAPGHASQANAAQAFRPERAAPQRRWAGPDRQAGDAQLLARWRTQLDLAPYARACLSQLGPGFVAIGVAPPPAQRIVRQYCPVADPMAAGFGGIDWSTTFLVCVGHDDMAFTIHLLPLEDKEP